MLIHNNIKQKVMPKILQNLHLLPKPVVFEPIPNDDDDNDELTKAINEPIYHDNNWDLHEAVNGEELEKFWDDATKELGAESAEAE
jgi:hypothetical protein